MYLDSIRSNGQKETQEARPSADSMAPTSTTSPENLLGSLSHLMGSEPEALRSQEKRISEIISQLQNLRDSIRSHQDSSPVQDKVSSSLQNLFLLCFERIRESRSY